MADIKGLSQATDNGESQALRGGEGRGEGEVNNNNNKTTNLVLEMV